MSINKHLHELLKEDQEPFQLEDYIADRRAQLNRPPRPIPKSILQLKKNKPIIETSSKSDNILGKHASFLPFHESQIGTKSQLSNFLNRPKSPGSTGTGSVFLQIPAQKEPRSKNRAHIKHIGVGLFSSVLKNFKGRNRNKKCEIQEAEVNKSRKREMKIEENFSGPSSEGWSESNEGRRSLDMETSTSSWRSENSPENIDFAAQEGEGRGFSPSRRRFCSSPLSPFRFSPLRSPSSGQHSTVLSSPASSPSRRKEQRKENFEGNNSGKNKREEMEQCSPVSVLDPTVENEEEEDVESSFAIVQRAKERLLYKLRKFEKLANLDPLELEKAMMEQLNGDDDDVQTESLDDNQSEYESFQVELSSSPVNLCSRRNKIPITMGTTCSAQFVEFGKSGTKCMDNGEILLGRILRKIDCWGGEVSRIIDLVVETDFRNELNEWKKCQEQRDETGMLIEVAVFEFLVEELAFDLVEMTS